MDWGEIGAIATIVAVVLALAAWLWPRAPVSTSPVVASPAPEPIQLPSQQVATPTSVGDSPGRAVPSPPLHLQRGLLVSIGLSVLATEKDMCIMVEAANPNPRPIRVVAVGLQMENKREVAFTQPGSDKGIPCLLQETENAHYWASAPEFGRVLVETGFGRKRKIRGYVTDSYDQRHFSEWTEFDPTYWANQQA